MHTPMKRDAATTTQDPRWLSVVVRDRSADGAFYYSVATSGVYCRPSCAARLANPKNVQFHRSRADAAAAGFRPCKRCKPELPIAVVGSTLKAAAHRMRFATGAFSLGVVLVAASDKGISAILLGGRAPALAQDVRRRFPDAEAVADDVGFVRLLAKVIQSVEMPWRPFDLPLDPRGSVFQLRVWRALSEIPAGSTASYSEIARRIAAPRAQRAVAAACASNPLAVAIPCHRVVKSDGALSGYRWGIARKAALLAREKASAA